MVMTFTVGCRHVDSYANKIFVFEKETAQEVLVEAENLEKGDVRIEYIETP